MKKKLSVILSIALIICMLPTTSAFAANIAKKAKSITVSPTSMTIMVGDIAQLNATKKPAKASGKLTWSSSDKSVATVSSKGVVQGVSEGTAIITVSTTNKKKATCTVVVKKYIEEDNIKDSIKEELKDEFATKNDIQSLINQNTYSKSEIDSKIDDISSSSADACDCTVKTAEDVINILKQNTYTKDEIDTMIAGKPDGLSTSGKVTLHEGQPMKFTDRNFSLTMDSINIEKSVFNDFAPEFDSDTFYTYKYDVEIKGKTNAHAITIMGSLINDFGAIEKIDLIPEVNDTGEFSIKTTVYCDVNATEAIINYFVPDN